MLVLPYISIVMEKTEHMATVWLQILEPMGVGVKGYFGNAENGSPFNDMALAVLTMEKANVTINRLVAEERLHELVCLVVDEAHMVADPHRGLVLELLLTKLRHACRLSQEAAAAAAAAAL
ncbi:uncharacterized protein HaLaN_11430, partial [Haematococcus lacustris]